MIAIGLLFLPILLTFIMVLFFDVVADFAVGVLRIFR